MFVFFSALSQKRVFLTETSGGTSGFVSLHPAPFPSSSHRQLAQAEFLELSVQGLSL